MVYSTDRDDWRTDESLILETSLDEMKAEFFVLEKTCLGLLHRLV
jgi:hypothetical protein